MEESSNINTEIPSENAKETKQFSAEEIKKFFIDEFESLHEKRYSREFTKTNTEADKEWFQSESRKLLFEKNTDRPTFSINPDLFTESPLYVPSKTNFEVKRLKSKKFFIVRAFNYIIDLFRPKYVFNSLPHSLVINDLDIVLNAHQLAVFRPIDKPSVSNSRDLISAINRGAVQMIGESIKKELYPNGDGSEFKPKHALKLN